MKVHQIFVKESINGYTEQGMQDKSLLHEEGIKLLNQMAIDLKLEPGTFDIRSNKAGPAVQGEITLHGDNIYLQIHEGFKGSAILFRTCNGRQDYSGDSNNTISFKRINENNDYYGLINRIERLIDAKKAVIASMNEVKQKQAENKVDSLHSSESDNKIINEHSDADEIEQIDNQRPARKRIRF